MQQKSPRTTARTSSAPPDDREPYTLAPFCLPLDWLQIRFSIGADANRRPWGGDDVVNLSERYAIHRKAQRSKAFDRIDDVLDKRTGRVVGELQSNPHNQQAIRANAVIFKAANESLYNYTWHGVLADLLDGHGWRYHATTQLDLAADGHGFLAPFHDAMRGEITPGGRSEWVVRNLPGMQGLKAVELGNKSSNKFGRIYGKSRELKISGKHYIADYWSENGCTDPDHVERCELKVKGRELRRYTEDERDRGFLDHLTCPTYRAKLYHSIAAPFLRFHTGEERSRDRTDLLNWDWSQVAKGERIEAAPRARRVGDIGLNALKTHIRLSYMLHVATDSRRYLTTAQEVAAAANLLPWMQTRAELWRRDAEKLVATGLRAASLFDLMQGADDEDASALQAEAAQRKAREAAEAARRKAIRADHRQKMRSRSAN